MDSDGTVMDTMTIKHERCFGPCFIEVFNIKDNVEDVLNVWNDLNLYTLTRGINRFQGLDKIIEYVKKYGYSFNGYDEFHNWVISTKEFSVKSIEETMKNAVDLTTFNLALIWSKRVNEEIVKLPRSNYFDGVKEILNEAYESCDLVGVSSANPQAVNEEWTSLGLIGYFKFVGCQDKGNKTSIIEQTLVNGYDKNLTVMLGDAVGDLKAAENNGVWFFPIVPKHEVESWKRFREEGLPNLLNGKFDKAYQEILINDFYKTLEN